MTDEEIIRKCAARMGYRVGTAAETGADEDEEGLMFYLGDYKAVMGVGATYDPLHDDAQAMALVKKFNITLDKERGGDPWEAIVWGRVPARPNIYVQNADLNRAICECVAKLSD